MTEIAFYHLQRQRLEEVLPLLLERAYSAAKRSLILVGSTERVTALDAVLWTYRRESFLPHGSQASGRTNEHPIFLTHIEENPNAASFLFLVDGGIASADFLALFERCFDVFDGNDEVAVAAARERWREAKIAGHKLTYWQQEGASWQKKAEV